MRRAQGYATIIEPGKATIEKDSFTCVHCNSVVFVSPMRDASEVGGFCMLCMKHICSACASTGACDPFEKKLERMEARDRLLRACG
jgi:hypothetical protein